MTEDKITLSSLDFSDDLRASLDTVRPENTEVVKPTLSKNTIEKVELFFSNFEIKNLSEDVVSLECKKNLFFYVDGNFLEVSKGDNIKIGKILRLNPLESWKYLRDNLSSICSKFLNQFSKFRINSKQLEHRECSECHQ